MEITYRIAHASEEKRQSRALIKSQYLESGYLSAGKALDEKMARHEEHTTTFVVWHEETVLATLSLIIDSSAGLPMDELYKKELDILRHRKKRLAEVTQLAAAEQTITQLFPHLSRKQRLTFVLPLFRFVLHFALWKELDALCIAINPKHALLYDTLGFENIGELRYYGSFNQAPALAKVLDLDTMRIMPEKKSFLEAELREPLDQAILEGRADLILPVN